MKEDTLDSNAPTDALVQRPMLEDMAGIFLGGDSSPTNPLANPLHADLEVLPLILIHVEGAETLLDDSRRFVTQAEDAGIDTTLLVVPEQQHVFPFLAGRSPEADRVVERMSEWVRPKLGLD